MRLVQVNKEKFITHLKLFGNKLNYFSMDSYNDYYFLYYTFGGVALRKKKNRIYEVNLLWSSQKGLGKEILQEVERITKYFFNGKYLVLNCLGDKLKKYYEEKGFKVYLKLKNYENTNDKYYYEMIKEL